LTLPPPIGYNPRTMKRHLSAASFDMGSTLSHQNPDREDLLVEFLQDRGYPRTLHDVRRALLDADTLWHTWGMSTPVPLRTDEARQAMRIRYRDTILTSLQLESNDGLAEDFADVFRTSIMRRHNATYPDVLPTLQALRSHGFRLAIVSNWDLSLEDHCRDLGLTAYFDAIVGSQSVGHEKPDPRIFQITLQRLGVSPDQTIHVGDMYLSDVVGSRRAGILPVLLDRYDLQPNVDCLRVRSLDEILPLILPNQQ